MKNIKAIFSLVLHLVVYAFVLFATSAAVVALNPIAGAITFLVGIPAVVYLLVRRFKKAKQETGENATDKTGRKILVWGAVVAGLCYFALNTTPPPVATDGKVAPGVNAVAAAPAASGAQSYSKKQTLRKFGLACDSDVTKSGDWYAVKCRGEGGAYAAVSSEYLNFIESPYSGESHRGKVKILCWASDPTPRVYVDTGVGDTAVSAFFRWNEGAVEKTTAIAPGFLSVEIQDKSVLKRLSGANSVAVGVVYKDDYGNHESVGYAIGLKGSSKAIKETLSRCG